MTFAIPMPDNEQQILEESQPIVQDVEFVNANDDELELAESAHRGYGGYGGYGRGFGGGYGGYGMLNF